MITFFSIPKPFEGDTARIQQNAIRSWLALHPSCEIILFGSDAGVAQAAAELKIRFEPNLLRNSAGTPLVSDCFEKAKKMSRHSILCYVNADIIMTQNLTSLIQKIESDPFLAIGRRWNMELKETLEFRGDWPHNLMERLCREGVMASPVAIDYFVFPKTLYGKIPPFAIGRTSWDNWLIYKACAEGACVIDLSRVFKVIHQNHDYLPSVHQNKRWVGEETKENLRLAGDLDYCFNIEDADYLMREDGNLEKNKLASSKSQFLSSRWLVLNENSVHWMWLAKPVLFMRLAARFAIRFLRRILPVKEHST